MLHSQLAWDSVPLETMSDVELEGREVALEDTLDLDIFSRIGWMF